MTFQVDTYVLHLLILFVFPFFFLPQVCDCKRIFFEGLTAIAFSSHKRSQRNIILPILLKRKYELGAFLRPFV